MDGKATRMMLATAALGAFALLLAAPVGAYVPEGDGVHANGAQSSVRQQAQSVAPGTIPYLSHGMGVDESQFGGQASQVDAQHQALVRNRDANAAAVELDPAIKTAVDARWSTLGLTGDSPLTRVAAPEPEGLTGDSAATRYVAPQTPTVSSGSSDIDWTSFGAGAGMVALLAAGCAGILLATRRRHTIGVS